MRILLIGYILLLPCIVQAEVPTTFGSMTFGQPPESEMVCIVGPCSSDQIRPDIKQNKIDLSIYKKHIDITTYGGWEISSPRYMFYEDRFTRVSFTIQCNQNQALRCMDEVAYALDQEYGLELLEAGAMELSEGQSIEGRLYKIGNDTVVRFIYDYNQSRGDSDKPDVIIECHSMMEKMRKSINPEYKSAKIDNR